MSHGPDRPSHVLEKFPRIDISGICMRRLAFSLDLPRCVVASGRIGNIDLSYKQECGLSTRRYLKHFIIFMNLSVVNTEDYNFLIVEL